LNANAIEIISILKCTFFPMPKCEMTFSAMC